MSFFLCLRLVLLFLAGTASRLPAQQFGLFTYTVQGGGATITITDYPVSATGPVVIPGEIAGKPVTAIGRGAFQACAELTAISIPPSVTLIDFDAFSGCRGLSIINLPSGLTFLGGDAFSSCSSLSGILLPAAIDSIRNGTFAGCTSLTSISIPENISTIGGYAFSGCHGLTSVILPASVIDIPANPFVSCKNLTSISVHPQNPAFVSHDGVLFSKSGTALAAYPTGKTGFYSVPHGTASIGAAAFYGTAGLTGVALPASLTTINYGAFVLCPLLEAITIPDGVLHLPPAAFSSCSGLANISLPAALRTIGDSAFGSCTALAGISLPTTLTSIGAGAFSDCTALAAISLPAALTSLPTNVFHGCSSLGSIAWPSALTSIGQGAFQECRALSSIHIPSGVRSIGGYAFQDCTGLLSASIPASVTSISFAAFDGCTGLTRITIASGITSISDSVFNNCRSLTSFSIPSSVTSISAYAFQGCAALTDLFIPAGLTSISATAFLFCSGISSFEVDPPNPAFASEVGVLYSKSRSSLLNYPGQKSGAFAIPSGVTSIGLYAFWGCRSLSQVTIPPSLAVLPQSPFPECSALLGIQVDPVNPAFSGTDGVLFNKSKTTLITYPAKKQGHYAIPASVSGVASKAFEGSSELTSISIPPGTIQLPSTPFKGCSRLAAIEVDPANPAFSSSNGILFDKSRRSLIAFPGAGSGHFIFPTGVFSIQDAAFHGCAELRSITFQQSAPTLTGTPFSGLHPDFSFYYLSTTSGFTAPTWNDYPAFRINEALYPAASWLIQYGLRYDTDLHQDPDGDGVEHLMAYALNLDPRMNLSARLPVPVIDSSYLSMTFYASAPGITYRVETSTDLMNWTINGVSFPFPGPGQGRTARVFRNGKSRFLRLRVTD